MFIHSTNKELTRLLRDIDKQIFEVLLVSYLLFYLLDQILNNIISDYFNLNIILIIVIISGAVMSFPAFSSEKEENKEKQAGLKDYLFIIGLGIVAAGVIYYKIDLFFWMRLAISIISGMIIILLSILLLYENNEKNP
ncbi:MAG: hypothetical protein ABIF80_04530 [Patescibacteria group bacterium]|nr:hypothetical protein [Patescibacteria group bacterium]